MSTDTSQGATPVPDDASSKNEAPVSIFETLKNAALLTPVAKLELQIKNNKLDLKSWLELIKLTVVQNDDTKTRKVYEDFLRIFPSNGDVFFSYINFELAKKNNDKVEELYERSLTKCHSLNLWKSYIDYVKSKNDIITGGYNSRLTVFQSYDTALKNVGFDLDAHIIWEDYLKFINEWNPISSYEESQKIEVKRKVFKKCVVIPSHKLEEFWTMYVSFENESSSVNARKFISEVSPQYMLARQWYKQYLILKKRYLSSLNTDELNEMRAMQIWINFEKENKMSIVNKRVLNARIEFAYVKTLQKFPFFAEVWFDYANFKLTESSLSDITATDKNKDGDKKSRFLPENLDFGISVLHDGLKMCPRSMLLTYLLAELYELKNDETMVVKTFDNLIHEHVQQYKQLEVDAAYLKKQIAKPLKSQNSKKRAHVEEDEEENGAEEEEDGYEIEPVDTSGNQKESDLNKYTTQQARDIHTQILWNVQFNMRKLERLITSIYINYIKTVKRAVKKNTARSVFKEARKSFKHLTWHIFYEEALLEYYTSDPQNGAKIALRIFETGMKSLNLRDHRNYPFLVEHLKFLIQINDHANIKSLFEMCIKNLTGPIDKSSTNDQKLVEAQRTKTLKKLFKHLMKYEYYNGTIYSMQNLQTRYSSFFPRDAQLSVYTQPFKEYDGFDMIREFEIDHNANTLCSAWRDYDHVVNSALSTQISVKDPTMFSSISRKLLHDGLIKNFDSSIDEEEDISRRNRDDLSNFGYIVASNGVDYKQYIEQMDELQQDDYAAEFDNAADDVAGLTIPGVDVDESKPFVGDNIYNLLRMLPNAKAFDTPIFNSEKLVAVLQSLKL